MVGLEEPVPAVNRVGWGFWPTSVCYAMRTRRDFPLGPVPWVRLLRSLLGVSRRLFGLFLRLRKTWRRLRELALWPFVVDRREQREEGHRWRWTVAYAACKVAGEEVVDSGTAAVILRELEGLGRD